MKILKVCPICNKRKSAHPIKEEYKRIQLCKTCYSIALNDHHDTKYVRLFGKTAKEIASLLDIQHQSVAYYLKKDSYVDMLLTKLKEEINE